MGGSGGGGGAGGCGGMYGERGQSGGASIGVLIECPLQNVRQNQLIVEQYHLF